MYECGESDLRFGVLIAVASLFFYLKFSCAATGVTVEGMGDVRLSVRARACTEMRRGLTIVFRSAPTVSRAGVLAG